MKAEELTIQITAEMDDDVKALVAGYKSQIEELKHQKQILENEKEGFCSFTVKVPKNDACDFLKMKDAVLKHFIKDRTIRFTSPSYDFDRDRIEIKVELIPVEED